MPRRRDFLAGVAAAAAAPAFAPLLRAAAQTAQTPGAMGTFEPDPATLDFWSKFLDSTSTPTRVPPPRTRGLGSVDRETFFLYAAEDGLQPAVDIPATALLPDGDVNVTLNLARFKPAHADVATFERLQNAQLRIDVLQNIPLVDLIDTMAWTAVALLRPDKQNKLPPMQSLSFDPSTSWKKMQNIPLPRGQGRWAMNLYAQRSDSFWSRLFQVVNKEVGRFAPVFGLPGITTTALQSFNEFYGAFHSRPEHLLVSHPVPIFATATALKQNPISTGLPLRTGKYVLVPVAHASAFTRDFLRSLKIDQGYLIPRDLDTPVPHAVAPKVPGLENVTYATMDVIVRPVQLPCKS